MAPFPEGTGHTDDMYIFILILSIASAFACQENQVSIVRRSGIGIGSNGRHSGNASQKVNVPVRFEGKWGCWEQEGGLSFDVKEKSNTLTVLIPKSSFKDIPGRTKSYALLSKVGSTVQMDIATFVCLGNQVLSAETFSGTVAEARVLQDLDAQVSTVFATGIAAQNLERQREEMAQRFGRSSELPGGLQKFFEESYTGSWAPLENYDVMVPTIYLSARMNTPLGSLSSSYHTRVLTKSACSPEFESVMSPLSFEKLGVPEGIKVKFKKGQLVLSF